MSQNKSRPLITFALTAYNQEMYIKQAIEGAFSQTYSPLEIILSDDCSSDNSFDIMKKLAGTYEGPHIIILNRNENNLGIAGHWNKILDLANGKYVVFADGDDISLQDRALKSWEILEKNPDCTYLNFSTINFTDEYQIGEMKKKGDYSLRKFSLFDLFKDSKFPIGGATTIVKSIFQLFGHLLNDTPTQDSTIQLRYLLKGPILKSTEPGIFYRIHGNNFSASDNKYLIDYDKIYLQYMTDLRKALSLGFVDNNIYKLVCIALEKELFRKKIWLKFNRQNRKLIIFISSILFSRHFSQKEKKKYFIQACKSTLKNVAQFLRLR